MALTSIAGSVASAIIKNLVNTCFSYLKAYRALRGTRGELERLQLAIPQILAVLTAVEEASSIAEQNEALDTWLWQLRDVVENAEDMLDELEYYELKKTIQDRDDKVRDILSKCKKRFNHFVNLKFSNDTLKRLREAVKGLDRVTASIGPFIQLVTGLYDPDVKPQKLEEINNSRETSSVLTENKVVGRDTERFWIVVSLIKQGDADVSVFSIVGMGDAATITRKMLENVSSGNFGDKSLNALHQVLKQKLMLKRFLLILDDVWNDDKAMECISQILVIAMV